MKETPRNLSNGHRLFRRRFGHQEDQPVNEMLAQPARVANMVMSTCRSRKEISLSSTVECINSTVPHNRKLYQTLLYL